MKGISSSRKSDKLLDTFETEMNILHKLSNLEEYPILAGVLLQDMQRAEYNTNNIGHYALGLEFYTHFTSPIRRLCDLLVHMLLDMILENSDLLYSLDFKQIELYLQEASKQASRMERQADAGEKESSKLAILKSMEKDIGEEFEATVIDTNDIIRVRLNGIDSFVKYQYLSDNFNYDEKQGKFYDIISTRLNQFFIKKVGEIVKAGANVIFERGLWTAEERKYIKEYYNNLGIENEIHYICVDTNTWEQNINERNKKIEAGYNSSDFYVNEGLKKKINSLWEEPKKEEYDFIYYVDRKS